MARRIERCLEVRIVDGLPVDETGMGRKIVRRYAVCNIEAIRLPSNRGMQRVVYEVKMALARENQRRRRR